MVNVLVCDDNQIAADFVKNNVEHMFKKCKIEYKCDVAASVTEALQRVDISDYDVLFLDIELKDGTGMKVAKYVRDLSKDAVIVFITSHTEYMHEAFGVHAYHYLQKPVEADELNKLVLDIINKISQTPQENDSFVFNFNKEIYALKYEDIACMYSELRLVSIISADGEYEYYGKIKDALDRLPDSLFVRVRSNFIINMTYISSIEEGKLYYRIPGRIGDNSVNISSSYKKHFMQKYAEYAKYRRQ